MIPTSSLPAIFVFAFVVTLGAVISPGPVSTAIVSQAPRRGWLAGPLVATGHSLLELVLVILVVLGLGVVLARSGVQIAIAFLGGALLAWMGGSMVWNIWRGRVHLPTKDDGQKAMGGEQLVLLGVVASAGNPYWYGWWMTVGLGYLVQSRALGLTAVLIFYLGHIAADFIWDTVLSVAVGSGRRWMNDTVYRLLILACGVFLLYLAWSFLSHGVALLG